MSRQLTQAWERKGLAENMDLLARIDKIIDRAEKIFSRNYAKESVSGDTLALKALGEQRSTIELLAKISAYLHQARLLELENSQDRFQEEREAEHKERLKKLSFEELLVMSYIQTKMMGGEIPDHLAHVAEMFKGLATAPAPPLPKPKLPPATPYSGLGGVAEPDPIPSPTPEPEPVDMPEKPKGLPPAPTGKILEASPGMRLRRYLLGQRAAQRQVADAGPGSATNWTGPLPPGDE
ncbi:MAG: hypothetical protein ACOZF2_08280 [Thermodesulfobacteriota bacterium]